MKMTLAQDFHSHSRDYYVRFKTHDLRDIVFEHLCSMEDSAVLEDAVQMYGDLSRRAGSTEWEGAGPQPVSLAWDWVLADGELQLLAAVLPRTNVQVIDRKGYDLPEAEAAPHIFHLIESLPWRAKVREALETEVSPGPAH